MFNRWFNPGMGVLILCFNLFLITLGVIKLPLAIWIALIIVSLPIVYILLETLYYRFDQWVQHIIDGIFEL